jgi:hypothetical protein
MHGPLDVKWRLYLCVVETLYVLRTSVMTHLPK